MKSPKTQKMPQDMMIAEFYNVKENVSIVTEALR